jgi:hypothetical protein
VFLERGRRETAGFLFSLKGEGERKKWGEREREREREKVSVGVCVFLEPLKKRKNPKKRRKKNLKTFAKPLHKKKNRPTSSATPGPSSTRTPSLPSLPP